MINMISISLLNIKHNRKILFVWLVLSIVYMGVWFQRQPASFGVLDYQTSYFMLNNIMMYFFACKLFAQDYQSGAIKTVYTGVMKRFTFFITKILTMIIYVLIIWVGAFVVNSVALFIVNNHLGIFDMLSKDIILTLIIYVLLAIFIGLAIGLLSIVTQNTIYIYTAGLIISVLVQQMTPFFVYNNLFGRFAGLNRVIYMIPPYIILCWTQVWEITKDEYFIWFAWVTLLTVCTKILIDRLGVKKVGSS